MTLEQDLELQGLKLERDDLQRQVENYRRYNVQQAETIQQMNEEHAAATAIIGYRDADIKRLEDEREEWRKGIRDLHASWLWSLLSKSVKAQLLRAL